MRRATTPAGRLDLVGRDLARASAVRARRLAPAGFVIALVAALGVAALRIDLIRVRYGLADAVNRERALLEERREMRARVRALRDPARLAVLARERGFVRPASIRRLGQESVRP